MFGRSSPHKASRAFIRGLASERGSYKRGEVVELLEVVELPKGLHILRDKFSVLIRVEVVEVTTRNGIEPVP